MRAKQKNILFDLFYKEFKMIDKMNYIKKVMDSCSTKEQLDSTLKWGKKVLWQNYNGMSKKLNSTSFCIPITFRIIDMTQEIEDELIKHHLKSLNNIKK